MDNGYNYQIWIAMEKILLNIFLIFILWKTHSIDLKKKNIHLVIVVYFLATLILNSTLSQLWYRFYCLLDIGLALYLSNTKKKAVFYVIVFQMIVQFINYIFIYYRFIYPINNMIFYFLPIFLSVMIFYSLYYFKCIKYNGLGMKFIFNIVAYIVWIILTKIIYQIEIYDIGMINYVYISMIAWVGVNFLLSYLQTYITNNS